MSHIFSESEAIAQANRNNNSCNYDLNHFTISKTSKPQIQINSKSKFKEYSYCRDCGCKLERKASKIFGICPLCDMK